MKSLFFDAGPIITLVMSRLVWILPKLKEKFGGSFYITPAVKFELVDRPLKTKRFELEALEVMKLIRSGVLEVYSEVLEKECVKLKQLANSAFKLKNRTMDIMQAGEVESITMARELDSAVVIDERTLRLFVENHKEMKTLLERRFKRKVTADKERMEEFSSLLKGVPIIRSIELVGVAYKMGILDDYVPKMKNARSLLVDAVLWATKVNGCAVTEHEIEELKRVLLKA